MMQPMAMKSLSVSVLERKPIDDRVRREPLGDDQVADDLAEDREDDRPADPVAERRQRADERAVPAPALMRVQRDATASVTEHRRRLGVDPGLEHSRSPRRAPHRTIEPITPNSPSVYPRLASRKPGLHSAMTNPSYQRSVLRSSTSSTLAVANSHPSYVDPGSVGRWWIPFLSGREPGLLRPGARFIPFRTRSVNAELCASSVGPRRRVSVAPALRWPRVAR